MDFFLKAASRTISKKLKSTHGILDGGPRSHEKTRKGNLAYADITTLAVAIVR
jgi:hypothetical protein